MKEKKPGDHLILRLKNNESPLILDWINEQSNLSDAIRFLIEEEIKANAIRDLQEYIPAKRKPLAVVVEHAATAETSSEVTKPSVEPEVQSRPEVERTPVKKEESVELETREPEPETEEQTPEPQEDQPVELQDVESNTENVPESEPEPEEDEGDEYSEEIIDHWMNI